MKRFISIFVIFLSFLNQNISHGMTATNKALFAECKSILSSAKEVCEKYLTKFDKNEIYEQALKEVVNADSALNIFKNNIEIENYLMKKYLVISFIVVFLPNLIKSAKKLFYKMILNRNVEDDESSFIRIITNCGNLSCILCLILSYNSELDKQLLNKKLFKLLKSDRTLKLTEAVEGLIRAAKLEKII